MSRYLKCIIGTIVNVVSGLAGTVIWALQSDTVRMKSDSKSVVMALLAVAFIPSAVIYVIWFVKNVKAMATPGGHKTSFVIPFCVGLVIIAAITLIPGIFMFTKAMKFFVIGMCIAVAGNLVSYLALKV